MGISRAMPSAIGCWIQPLLTASLLQSRRHHQTAIQRIREGLEVHAIGLVVRKQQFPRSLIALVAPPVPLADGIVSRKTLERRYTIDAHPAFNGFEPSVIA